MTVSDTHVCECGHPISSHPGADYGRGSCVATVLTNAPLGGGSTYQCPCKTYSEARGNDTHADTIREAFEDALTVFAGSQWARYWDEPLTSALSALVAEVERERARADRAEAALEPLVEALGWALDVLEISLKRLDAIEEDPYSDKHLRLRAAGLAKARAALSAGSGGREPPEEEALIQVPGPPGYPPLRLTKAQYDSLVNTGGRETRPEGHEGMVTVYDHNGGYLGCMGRETWKKAVADEAERRKTST